MSGRSGKKKSVLFLTAEQVMAPSFSLGWHMFFKVGDGGCILLHYRHLNTSPVENRTIFELV
jgi:hypothetical protein